MPTFPSLGLLLMGSLVCMIFGFPLLIVGAVLSIWVDNFKAWRQRRNS